MFFSLIRREQIKKIKIVVDLLSRSVIIETNVENITKNS